MLFGGFPPNNHNLLLWGLLTSLLVFITRYKLKISFVISYACGILFFLGIFNWIFKIPGYNYFHHTVLSLYLGLYFAVFGLTIGLISRRFGPTAGLSAAPFTWVSIEYIRSHFFFLALPWALLAHSQYKQPVILQLASITGVYGVSFLIVLTNAALAALLLLLFPGMDGGLTLSDIHRSNAGKRALIGIAAICLTLTLLYGFIRTSRPLKGNKLKLSIVQGNIEQHKKWDREYAQYIIRTYIDLTEKASQDNPDLIIWPETATPGSVNQRPSLYIKLRQLAKESNAYLLFGSAQRQKFDHDDSDEILYFNSAFLLPPDRKKEKAQRYDKIRLFPFGEYLPMKDLLPWSFINVPEVRGYVPGKELGVLKMNDISFGVTICWENLFPGLVRQSVKMGAQFIVNLTNEAWFGESAAPEQFLSMNVFRAVENGVYVIRCANTGISCFIDPYGWVVDRVKNRNGKDTFVRGYLTGEIVPLKLNTLYTRYGDWCAWLCLAVSGAFLSAALASKKPGY